MGRFRSSLLGKRVDYSGRAVIVVNPTLKIWQCGLPRKIAEELYRPFVLGRLKSFGLEVPKQMLAEDEELALENLTRVMADHPVLLNRAPTLHRMNVQAFFPVLSHGNVIELHPLVCRAFNADFDGDQMAVHLPLSFEAQVEARTLLASRENLLSPANGEAVFGPSQDMVMGLYYLTMKPHGKVEPRGVYGCCRELELARAAGKVNVHDRIEFRIAASREIVPADGGDANRTGSRRIETTVGRSLVSGRLPEGMPFYKMALSAKVLSSIVKKSFEVRGRAETLRLVEELASLGLTESTRSGLSIGIGDLVIPERKMEIVGQAREVAKRSYQRQSEGKLSIVALKSRLIDTWKAATDEVAEALIEALQNESRPSGSVNPVLVMAESGARGSVAQLKQLSGMRGLTARATGEVAEHPITSNFREGLNLGEFFVSTHGARKSFSDVGLKTAEGGYLTRRLVHAASRVVVTMCDCGTKRGIVKRGGKSANLSNLVVGRVSLEEVRRRGEACSTRTNW